MLMSAPQPGCSLGYSFRSGLVLEGGPSDCSTVLGCDAETLAAPSCVVPAYRGIALCDASSECLGYGNIYDYGPWNVDFGVGGSIATCASTGCIVLLCGSILVSENNWDTCVKNASPPPPPPPPSPPPPMLYDLAYGLHAWFDMQSYSSATGVWADKSGYATGRSVTSSGVSLASSPAGTAGSTCALSYLTGTSESTMVFNMPQLPTAPFSMCTVSRYTSATQGLIFMSTPNVNWRVPPFYQPVCVCLPARPMHSAAAGCTAIGLGAQASTGQAPGLSEAQEPSPRRRTGSLFVLRWKAQPRRPW